MPSWWGCSFGVARPSPSGVHIQSTVTNGGLQLHITITFTFTSIYRLKLHHSLLNLVLASRHSLWKDSLVLYGYVKIKCLQITDYIQVYIAHQIEAITRSRLSTAKSPNSLKNPPSRDNTTLQLQWLHRLSTEQIKIKFSPDLRHLRGYHHLDDCYALDVFASTWSLKSQGSVLGHTQVVSA
jgi:hypothetical protein